MAEPIRITIQMLWVMISVNGLQMLNRLAFLKVTNIKNAAVAMQRTKKPFLFHRFMLMKTMMEFATFVARLVFAAFADKFTTASWAAS